MKLDFLRVFDNSTKTSYVPTFQVFSPKSKRNTGLVSGAYLRHTLL